MIAVSIVIGLVAWIGASHIQEPYHPEVVQLLEERMAAERQWNESKHEASLADRRSMSEQQARITTILEQIDERLDRLETQ